MWVLGIFKWTRGKNVLFLTILFLYAASIVFFVNGSQREDKNQSSVLNQQKESAPSLTLDVNNITINSNESHHPFVILNEADGSKVNVSEQSQYSTSNANVATVNESGVITAVAPGIANIMIRYGEFTRNIVVSVITNNLQVNVREYGAVGDGVADDTRAFKDAIDDLAAKGGGNLFVPKGTYILHPIFLKPKVNLVGENRDTVTLKLADNVPDGQNRLITMDDFTKVQNITCDGNYLNHPNGTEHMHCIFAYDNDHLLIDNNRLINAVGDGISISGSTEASDYVIISNNTIEENQRSQIVIEQANHLRIFNNSISSKTGRPGIHFEPWEEMQYYDAKIFGNTINTNTDGYAVLLTGGESGEGGQGYLFHGIEFYQNTVNCPTGLFRIIDTSGVKLFENKLNVKYVHVWRKNEYVNIYNNLINGEVGVRIEGGWEGNLVSTGTKIYGNTFHTLKEGILIQEAAEEINIYNNTFFGSGKYSGVKLFASEDIHNLNLSDNTFSNYEQGVSFDYDSYGDTVIKGVTVRNNNFYDIINFALYIMGPVHTITIDKNVVSNSSGAYIYVQEGRPMSNIIITNNIISGGKYGITQTENGSGLLDGLRITGNQISHTTDTGEGNLSGAAIELDQYAIPPTNVSISENILTNNARNFITVPNSLLNSVYDNIIHNK